MNTKPEQASELKLSEFLCFAVYSANLAFSKVYRPILDALGLTYTQYVTLVALWEENDQTVSGLGEKLFLESNTLTPILKKLEGMGYVERLRDPTDERQVRIQVTKSGRRLRDKAVVAVSDLGTATGLGPKEFSRLQKEIVTLRNSLLQSADHAG
ncbi:MarR family winged helix-turn-helix transcriptional regulator [Lysobacter solisilvae (ex Woo and Kim 2020)]|uniref:MarR family transcriptional regulator n=1 Tax=Agrilutibacter terrestris TaxID=2865112 RepID=A0A7H0G0T9_9GAMM|nr:MarR family transcriptional regulator [Lysobacter terrestris]QNP41905.1 MarR family transcriptional regulator [Lysobacter terrestris]